MFAGGGIAVHGNIAQELPSCFSARAYAAGSRCAEGTTLILHPISRGRSVTVKQSHSYYKQDCVPFYSRVAAQHPMLQEACSAALLAMSKIMCP